MSVHDLAGRKALVSSGALGLGAGMAAAGPQPQRRARLASGGQAPGHRELLAVLRSFGLVMEPSLTVQH